MSQPILNSNQIGFTFIEVVIALFLLSIVLLNMGNIQLTSTLYNQQAYFLYVATEQLQSIAEKINKNQGSLSSLTQVWNKENKKVLPKGWGEINSESTHHIIRLYWRTDLSFLWRCQMTPITHLACLELKVTHL